MNCKHCGKEVEEEGTGLNYYDYCSSYCYAAYNKKFSSLIYQRGPQ